MWNSKYKEDFKDIFKLIQIFYFADEKNKYQKWCSQNQTEFAGFRTKTKTVDIVVETLLCCLGARFREGLESDVFSPTFRIHCCFVCF